MIDGSQFLFHTSNPKSHLLGLQCWEILVDEVTGQRINDTRYTALRGMDIKLKPSMDGGYNLIANGSLHKFYNCGEHNADQFTFSSLVQSIDSLTDLFNLNANECTLHGLEIGVNIELPYSPLRVLKNLVCFRAKAFAQVNKNNVRKGLQCCLSQYALKIYDKAKQSGVECGNLLRVEVAITKMQAINKFKIATLADLQEPTKVYPLIQLLTEALDGIVWTDGSVNLNLLTDREQKQWLYFSNPKTWAAMGKYQRRRALKTWKKLLNRYGNPPMLIPFVLNTWQTLFACEFEAEKEPLSYPSDGRTEALVSATSLPLECTVKKLLHNPDNSQQLTTSFPIIKKEDITIDKPYGVGKRKKNCSSCGRDISKQN